MGRFEDAVTVLADGGLNLCAVLDVATLPEAIRAAFMQAEVVLDAYQRLVLLGNAGKDLWPALLADGMAGPDPIDRYSTQLAARFVAQVAPSARSLHLYPNGPLLPIQQLGRLAGWHHDSPLGLGIHARYGVWFAYRALLLVDAPLPLRRDALGQSPCDSCVEKPCLGACPAGAVREIGRFSVPRCAAHRLQAGSGCADRCLSRLACPVAPEHRYPLAQVQYHYGQSMETLRAWYGESPQGW